MDFHTNKIRKIRHETFQTKPTDNSRKQSAKYISISISLLISLAIIIFLSIGIAKAIKNIDYSALLSMAGSELKTDGYGHTNFLILGIGGGSHDGPDLTDTMIVTSLNPENGYVSMLSIPRDLYMKDGSLYDSRVNEIYYKAKKRFKSQAKGVEYTKEKIEELTGIPIHYWVKVDFQGFKSLIDTLGGIDIYVTENLNDPFYPKDGTVLFEPFKITKGEHHMDGEMALKYSRSRKTTSDFDRARRQQQVIYAIKEKALSTNTLMDVDKIENIFSVLKDNIETNITVKEILTLGAVASKLTQDKISHSLIHDDPGLCGGLLYPEKRDNMFTLAMAGGISYIHRYTDLIFNYPLAIEEKPKIEILNGTPREGAAAETKQVLRRYCFDIVKFGNAKSKDIARTTYYYRQKIDEKGDKIDSRPKALDFLKKIIPGVESTEIPANYINSTADIIIELGSDYTNSKNYIEDPFYSLPPPVSAAAKKQESAETTEPEDPTKPMETTTP